MDTMNIVYAVAVLFIMGIVFAILLGSGGQGVRRRGG